MKQSPARNSQLEKGRDLLTKFRSNRSNESESLTSKPTVSDTSISAKTESVYKYEYHAADGSVILAADLNMPTIGSFCVDGPPGVPLEHSEPNDPLTCDAFLTTPYIKDQGTQNLSQQHNTSSHELIHTSTTEDQQMNDHAMVAQSQTVKHNMISPLQDTSLPDDQMAIFSPPFTDSVLNSSENEKLLDHPHPPPNHDEIQDETKESQEFHAMQAKAHPSQSKEIEELSQQTQTIISPDINLLNRTDSSTTHANQSPSISPSFIRFYDQMLTKEEAEHTMESLYSKVVELSSHAQALFTQNQALETQNHLLEQLVRQTRAAMNTDNNNSNNNNSYSSNNTNSKIVEQASSSSSEIPENSSLAIGSEQLFQALSSVLSHIVVVERTCQLTSHHSHLTWAPNKCEVDVLTTDGIDDINVKGPSTSSRSESLSTSQDEIETVNATSSLDESSSPQNSTVLISNETVSQEKVKSEHEKEMENDEIDETTGNSISNSNSMVIFGCPLSIVSTLGDLKAFISSCLPLPLLAQTLQVAESHIQSQAFISEIGDVKDAISKLSSSFSSALPPALDDETILEPQNIIHLLQELITLTQDLETKDDSILLLQEQLAASNDTIAVLLDYYYAHVTALSTSKQRPSNSSATAAGTNTPMASGTSSYPYPPQSLPGKSCYPSQTNSSISSKHGDSVDYDQGRNGNGQSEKPSGADNLSRMFSARQHFLQHPQSQLQSQHDVKPLPLITPRLGYDYHTPEVDFTQTIPLFKEKNTNIPLQRLEQETERLHAMIVLAEKDKVLLRRETFRLKNENNRLPQDQD